MCNITKQLFALFILAMPIGAALAQEDAKALARGAFYSIEAYPFKRVTVKNAIEVIKRAEKLNPKEPWVAIATSRMWLEKGYRKGDRYKTTNFEAEELTKAEYYAKQGVSLGPTESLAYSQLARIQIIRGDYGTALQTLNQAHSKDASDFYPWYLRGVLRARMKDAVRAKAALDKADEYATVLYQRRFVLRERIVLAGLLKDRTAEERYYKAIIELDPQDPYAHGNYGNFLLSQKRYDEAIASFEKALSIAPYPLAREQLERARLLKNSASK